MLLERCLDAIAREQAALPFETEVLVLDNASRDGSAGMARAHPVTTELIRREQRRGKAENDSALMQRARGRFCLLLNEDSELLPGATAALHAALAEHPRRGRRGREAAAPGRPPAAVGVALPDAGDGARGRALPAQMADGAEQGRSGARGRLGAVGRAARARARRRSGSAGWTRPSSSTPTRSTSASACATPAGRVLYVPRRAGDPPRAAVDRQRADAADRRALAQPRPLHAQAPLARSRRCSCAG